MEDKRFSIRMPDELYKKLLEEANEKNITVTSIIKMILSDYFKNKK